MVALAIFIGFLVVSFSAIAIFAFFNEENFIGTILLIASFFIGALLIVTIEKITKGDTYDQNSTIVKVMNNDPSLEIDIIALDKNGKIREVRIKEKR